MKKNLENEVKFLNLLNQEDYSIQEQFEYKSLKQEVLIKHNICETIYKVRISNFIILNRRCPNKICLDEKRKKTCLEKYGVERACQSLEIQEKQKKTFLEKYGVEYIQQNKEVREKGKKTNIERYGFENPTQNKEVKQKQLNTTKERFGVESVFQNKEIREKIKQTMIERYGVENAMMSSEVKEKCFKIFGGNSPFCDKDIREKAIKSKLENSFKNKISTFENDFKIKPLFSIEEFIGVKNSEYKFQCLKCGSIFTQRIDGNRFYPRCYECEPINKSNIELEMVDFIREYVECENNKRFYIEGKKFYELDCFIPSLDIGFEMDGIKWHCESFAGKDKFYHLDKNNFFRNKGIIIYRIWENEWNNKKDIVKSILLNKINKTQNKIFARNLKIEKLDFKTAKDFYNCNHIQGACISSLNYGLINNNKVYLVLSTSRSRFNKNYDFEIIRFGGLLNTTIVGGFSKLLSIFIKENNPKNIITYADKRYSNGNLYIKNAFNLLRESDPNYFYTKDYFVLQNRLIFQKYKLENKLLNYDSNLTEWENMKSNGYDRIWDCGNYVFEKTF